MNVIIKECNYNDILELRRKVMYPEKDLDYVKVENDEDKSGSTIHLGLYENRSEREKPISIISLFLNKDKKEMQFRKFATKIEFQNKGYGTELLSYVINYAKTNSIKRIWCNSRAEKSDFYVKKFNFNLTNQTYTKDGRDFIILERFL
ncbi:hypothetical protein RB653_008762 [Dictyostelium firmibasis]|uniref:N-acetyltransferase domain-containing protein n=1 Tax=Dictyostelium firmibasis TaxID=79012 RepID=A0AAN7U0M4_9MYCE